MPLLSRRQFLVGTSASTLPFLLSSCGRAREQVADIVLLNGEIHTVDPASSRVEALAITRGHVLQTGTTREIKKFIGPDTRQIDLAGRTALPGINDSHLHLMGWALGRPPYSLDVTYPTVKSISDVTHSVAQAASSLKPGEWITGRGWDQPYLAEGRPPSRADLDAVAPENPVALTEFSGHAVWANSLALKLAGIDRNTVPEPGGVIVKDDTGEPTGLLFEGPAFQMRGTIPAPDDKLKASAIILAMQQQLARGVTSATEPGLSPSDQAIYVDIAKRTDVPRLRMNAMLRAGTSTETLAEGLAALAQLSTHDPGWLQLGAVKIMGDGIPTANKTAWLNKPYVGGGNGSLLVDGATDEEKVTQLNDMIRMIHEAGLQAGTHVTGSRSIDETVAAYADVQRANYREDPRHYLIHADLASEETLAKMAELKVGGNFNPEIKFLIADSQVKSIGPLRAAYEWPFRSALDAGVVVASSSDAPVTEGNWLQGIATCMQRLGKQSGEVSGPRQRINLDEAIRTYTIAGAWQDHADAYKGSLVPGKVADICVLDGRLSDTDPGEFASMNNVMTILDGVIVYST